MIKSAVTKKGKNLFGLGESANMSRSHRQEGDIWQRRFWEHVIRDEQDFRRHLDYLHWNPVKHGYVKRVIDWPYSTFHRFVRPGIYPADWGGIQDEAIAGVRFGE